MRYAHIALVLVNLGALSGVANTALAQSPGQSWVNEKDVNNGPAVLAELRAISEKVHSGKLTDAEVERLKVIQKQAAKNEAMRLAMGSHRSHYQPPPPVPGAPAQLGGSGTWTVPPSASFGDQAARDTTPSAPAQSGPEVWEEISKILDLTIAEYVEKGGTEIAAPERSTSDADTATMALLMSFAMADFCADRGQAFQATDIDKLKVRIATMLDQLRVPKEKRDATWQAIQRGLKTSGMQQLNGRDLARQCGQHWETMAGMFPGVLPQDVGKKNPF
jgi:hypothetical protein